MHTDSFEKRGNQMRVATVVVLVSYDTLLHYVICRAAQPLSVFSTSFPFFFSLNDYMLHAHG